MLTEDRVIEPSIDVLIEEFKYKVKPTPCHKELLEAIEAYYKDNEKFMKKNNVLAGRRARKHLLRIFHLVRQRRGEISEVMYGGQNAT